MHLQKELKVKCIQSATYPLRPRTTLSAHQNNYNKLEEVGLTLLNLTYLMVILTWMQSKQNQHNDIAVARKLITVFE